MKFFIVGTFNEVVFDFFLNKFYLFDDYENMSYNNNITKE